MATEAGEVFEEFVRGRSTQLFRLALLLTGQNRAEAEDLLQIALERAYRRRTMLSRGRSPEPYVRQILVNASIDRWRLLRRRAEQPLGAAEAGPTVPDRTGEIADRDLLLRALAALPPRQRAVLVLRYFQDLSDAEIAGTLGCSVGTVKSQVSRGLARLRTAAEVSGAAPDHTPAEASGAAPDHTPAEASGAAPDHTPAEQRGAAPDHTPAEQRGAAPDHTAAEARGAAPDHTAAEASAAPPTDRWEVLERGD